MPHSRTAAALSIALFAPGLLSAGWVGAPSPAPGTFKASAAHGPVAGEPPSRPILNPADTVPVPTDPTQLRTFLADGSYETWPHQAAPHAAESPHGDRARVFLNPSLAGSVEARNPVHHQGAAAVLEMSDTSGLQWGWAVAVKVQASSNHGHGWYWYQVKSAPGSGKTAHGDYLIPEAPDAAGLGIPTCLTCHVKGHDYIITRSLD